MNVNIDIEPGAKNVSAEKVVLVRFFDRPLQDLRTFRKLASYIYVRRPGTERETRDGDAFQQLMRIFVDDVAVLERARLRFVRIANQIDRLLLVSLDEIPFYTARKPGAATTPQTRCLHFVHDVGARHLDRFTQIIVTAIVQIGLDVGLPIFASDVFENDPVLERMRLRPIHDSRFTILAKIDN